MLAGPDGSPAGERPGFRLSYLVKGFPGHPTHPPLTDATIGVYTAATALAIADVGGLIDRNAARGWWLVLLIGLVITVPTALTGVADWLDITWGSEVWKTATFHMTVMLTATVLFGLAALFGHDGYEVGDVETGPFVLTLAGFAALTLGGWLGGSVVYVYGMRVLGLVEEPVERAVTPGHPEKERAEGA